MVTRRFCSRRGGHRGGHRGAEGGSAEQPTQLVLGASATLGFAMPVIKVGWGLTVALSVTKSTLLRFSHLRDGVVMAPTEEGKAGWQDTATEASLAATSEVLISDD